MKINCSIDGKSVSPDKANISIFDNSLFYADGLFETILAVEDRPIFLKEHLVRLEKGAEMIHLSLPVGISTVRHWVEREVKRNSAHVKKIRLTVTSGESGFWRGKPGRPRIIIIATDHVIPEGPFRLTISPFRVDDHLPFRNVKTLAFVIEMTLRKLAYMKRFDDAILLNRSGHVAEATSANLFWVKKRHLYTSPLSSGCLDGMTRRHILQIAQSNRIPVSEKNVPLSELLGADEIFITSSLKLIIPVTEIKSDRKHLFKSGETTAFLRDQLRSFVLENRK